MLFLGEQHAEFFLYSRLFLFTYAFLLRMPSEAVGASVGAGDQRLELVGETLVLKLRRRKNKPAGSTLIRGCWCRECKASCPVHVLGPLVASCGIGERGFPGLYCGASHHLCICFLGAGINAAEALRTLRRMLELLGVEDHKNYRSHDLRRGHAKDLQLSGELDMRMQSWHCLL